MTCQDARAVFFELLDSRTPSSAHHGVRAHVAHCADCQREFNALARTASALDALPAAVPSQQLRQSFHKMLEQEKLSSATSAVTRAHPARLQSARRLLFWRWVLAPLVGCVLLSLGFLAGNRSAAPVPETGRSAVQDDTTQRELAALREQIKEQRRQIDKMTTLVGYSILQQQRNPANERLRDVLAAARTENVNDKILDDLIQALTLDPSANVRLRALEALFPHAERATVRAGVLAALPREQNPLVQLELIDFVATAQDPNATLLLQKISADETTNRTVREAARLALAQF
ncbi:MAG: hypothetical protein ACREH8_23450 [Opitutaceae bacterium]